MRPIAAAALLVAACSREPSVAETPGARLEAAASAAGMIHDPRAGSLVGSWSRDTDRMCALPAAKGGFVVGVSVDYGPGQQCTGRGTAMRVGETVRFALGDCRVEAHVDGDSLVFPATVPDACESLCRGRASIASLRVERIGGSLSEAAMMRDPRGKPLCTD